MTTVVIIAHRLSTVRHADIVVYLDDGCVMPAGTFGKVCAQVIKSDACIINGAW